MANMVSTMVPIIPRVDPVAVPILNTNLRQTTGLLFLSEAFEQLKFEKIP